MKKFALIFWFPSLFYAVTYTVTDPVNGTCSAHPNSLECAISSAASGDTIRFSLPAGSTTTTLTSDLPCSNASPLTFQIQPTDHSVIINGQDLYSGLQVFGEVTFDLAQGKSLTVSNTIIPSSPGSCSIPDTFSNAFVSTTVSSSITGTAGTLVFTADQLGNPTALTLLSTEAEINQGGTFFLTGPSTSLPGTSSALNLVTVFTNGLSVGADNLPGATLAGSGVLASESAILVTGGGIIAPASGTAGSGFLGLVTPNLQFSLIPSTPSIVQSAITPTTVGTLAVTNLPSISVDLSGAQLNLTVPATFPSAPTIYVPFITPNGVITNPFEEVLINGTPSTNDVFYSPQVDPSAVLVAVNVPTGISIANIVVGNLTFESVVLSDPCAGIVVLDLLSSSQLANLSNTFFANQCTLTVQALNGVATSVNAQILRQKPAYSPVTSGPVSANPVAAWHQSKALIAQATHPEEKKEAPPQATPNRTPLLDKPSWNFPKGPQFSFGAYTFGQFQNQDAITLSNVSLPSYNTRTGGLMLEFDYLGMNSILVGGTGAYYFTHLQLGQNRGNQNVQSVLGAFFASFLFKHLTLDLLVSGGYNRNNSTRNFAPIPGTPIVIPEISYTFQTAGIPGGTATSSFNTYQLTPHFDLNYEIPFGWISLVPFIQSDCVITFEEAFNETGAGSFTFSSCNITQILNTSSESFTNFMLQNEAGLTLFEQINLKEKGVFVFRQKGSYVNRYTIPYIFQTKFIGQSAFQDFRIDLPMQHFFGSAAEIVYRYVSLSVVLTYEGLIGSGFLSNAAFLRIAKDF